DILFDEKIAGSIHFTPGACYDEASNGNKSDIHWDMVLCQTPEYGGGEMYFDNELIRKDGRFVVKDLLPLNPENLLSTDEPGGRKTVRAKPKPGKKQTHPAAKASARPRRRVGR